MMQQMTAAEALWVNESIRKAVSAAQSAAVESGMVQDPQLRQFLQSESQRHSRNLQRFQGTMGVASQGVRQ